jgi:hypothetical protein
MNSFGQSRITGLIFGAIVAAFITACSPSTDRAKTPTSLTEVAVIGAIHGQHLRSDSYSLDVLREAIVKLKPDIIMVELPPDRFAAASANFRKYGEVREGRADDFPELVNIVFPLREKLGFEMVPVAAWTKKMADDRRAKLKAIENDPARREDWAAHQSAIKRYNRTVSGKSDDPKFVHSKTYDAAVKDRQETFQHLFGDELRAGGWETINASHIALMMEKFDAIEGEKKRVLILFGAWHKYKISEALEARSDIELIDIRSYF